MLLATTENASEALTVVCMSATFSSQALPVAPKERGWKCELCAHWQ
jgi:hypothetical protein